MSTSRHRGERLGACTDCRRFWARYRAGDIDQSEIEQVEGRLATTAGTCAVMGTASTMACLTEALGMGLPGSAAAPAVHADRLRIAEETGARAAALIGSRPHARRGSSRRPRSRTPSACCWPSAARPMPSSTSPPSPRRRGFALDLKRFNELSETTPVLVNLKPVGHRLHGGPLRRRRRRRGAARTQRRCSISPA